MKDDSVFLMGLAAFALLVLGGVVLVITGDSLGAVSERDRIYTKCLTEHEALPHKDAVALCKERVK